MTANNRRSLGFGILAALALAYFVVFPDDAATLLAPVVSAAAPVESVLRLSNAISPWLYLVGGVGIIAWTAVRIWGRRA